MIAVSEGRETTPQAIDLSEHRLVASLHGALPHIPVEHIKAVLEALPKAVCEDMRARAVLEVPGVVSMAVVEMPGLRQRLGYDPRTRQPITRPASPAERSTWVLSLFGDAPGHVPAVQDEC
ncbi:MAG: hypothetical protein U0271_30785 [Polyangiaceae bacterium]